MSLRRRLHTNSYGDFLISQAFLPITFLERIDLVMKKTMTDRRTMIRTMVAVAVFCAVAYICQFIFRIRVFGFLTFDAKDAVMAVGAMAFGPVWGFVMSILLATIESITMGETGVIGWIMDLLSSASFVCVAALIYRFKRTMSGAILALSASVLSTTAVMLVLNLFLTPLYLPGATMASVAAMIPSTLLPFNLTKAFLNAGLVLVLYKPISTAMKNAKVVKGEPSSLRFDRKSILMLAIGILLIAACVAAFLLLMNGRFEWG